MRVLAAAALLAVLAVLVGCGSEPAAEEPTEEPAGLDPAEFSSEVTNPWFPLEPGTRWTYRETTEDGEKVLVVVTATSVTREIANGVTARVVRDTVTLDGEIIEDTLDWYAQDADGTVWYVGEDTAEFEDGELANRDGSFEAGVDGAEAGVIMPATPEVGMKYQQEYYRGEAEDRGEVLAFGQRARVPAGEYDGLLQTADTTPLEPDVLEHKFYAEGVGLVLTVDKESAGREELLSVTKVSPAEARSAGTAPLGTPY
ncbi:hypothetical protein [Nocardioides speluncae]|uniref:hypothetical protein n=1 Tax=Nocardioides speluncae TaxID=2670337 RepID=UPI000D68D6B1|nr:hypothetical protein [Nocardioides speluncae]